MFRTVILYCTAPQADFRNAVRVLGSMTKQHTIGILWPNDTDVSISILHQIPIFLQHNLHDLWVRAEVLDTYTTRHVLPRVYERLLSKLCVLPATHTFAVHAFRVGTEKSTLKVESELLKHWNISEVRINPWAPSQYKDRLIYVWRFPC